MSNTLAVKDATVLDIALPDFGNAPQFDAPPQSERRVVYWMNGNPQMRRAGGTDYTGCWAIQAENLNPDILKSSAWDLETKIARGTNKEFQVYTTPVLRVAMLGWRESWMTRQRADGETPTYQQHYAEGLTSYVEVAAIADSIKVPIVLTAKGMNGNQLKKAYARAVGDLNRAFKKPIPPFAFYMALGGEVNEKGEPVFTLYGKGKEQSNVTHIMPRWTLDNTYLKAAQVPDATLDLAREFVSIALPRWKVERFQQVVVTQPAEQGDVMPEDVAI